MTATGGWAYSDIVKDHFMNPRNILKDEESYHEDGKGTVGNVKCGDQMTVVIKVDKENDVITDCKWKTYGCASAIASTSVLSQMVVGMTLEQAFRVTPKDVTKELGALPEHKIHCSVLGDKALQEAINDYYRRSGQDGKVMEEEARIICQCMNVTDHEIEHAVLEGARTLYRLQERTKLGTVCGQCRDEATELINTFVHQHFDD